jgi:hypothetical protein
MDFDAIEVPYLLLPRLPCPNVKLCRFVAPQETRGTWRCVTNELLTYVGHADMSVKLCGCCKLACLIMADIHISTTLATLSSL